MERNKEKKLKGPCLIAEEDGLKRIWNEGKKEEKKEKLCINEEEKEKTEGKERR